MFGLTKPNPDERPNARGRKSAGRIAACGVAILEHAVPSSTERTSISGSIQSDVQNLDTLCDMGKATNRDVAQSVANVIGKINHILNQCIADAQEDPSHCFHYVSGMEAIEKRMMVLCEVFENAFERRVLGSKGLGASARLAAVADMTRKHIRGKKQHMDAIRLMIEVLNGYRRLCTCL